MLLTVLNYAGIALFAASGALIAVRRGLDVVGVWTLGLVTGLGGGIIRDLLLGKTPPDTFQGWENLTVAAAAATVVFVLHQQFGRLRRMVLVLDAFGVALFASSGALMAAHFGTSGFAATLIGITTALGGGILRDILVNEMPLLLEDGDLLVLPALGGAATTVVLHVNGVPDNACLIAGTAVAFAFRVMALWREWRAPHAPEDPIGSLTAMLRRCRKGPRSAVRGREGRGS
ncbi:trimeric intracellular cation channel family protein [Williamsia sterculiae]|uniref:Uncharacterized membrane protein YeiH n=1 Tax=Williamsia sterculiae TaxID=1344003 RepID=A0A1N7GXS9_9NOCA|nr:TRIC cation channel family protein [Williamsia sterculiae]SIS17346.1 Uncharacterized membrane protein YeiH [Williamsia sterculiae]